MNKLFKSYKRRATCKFMSSPLNRKRFFYSLKQSWVLPYQVDTGNLQVGLQILNILYCKYCSMALVIIVLGRSGHQTLLASAFWMKEGKTIWGHLKKKKKTTHMSWFWQDWQSNWALQNHRCYFFNVMCSSSRRPM